MAPPGGSTGVRRYAWRGHQIAWRAEGAGPALLLVHSIHAAASHQEWLQVVPRLARRFRVYTFDLLGFGASDRPDADYSADLFIELVADVLRDVVQEPAVLVGSSLGATYAIATAARHPDRVRAVAAVGPAGLERLAGPPNAVTRALRATFRSRVPGRLLFDALVSRPSIRLFLRGVYRRTPVTTTLLERYWRTAHAPGARFAPAAFVGMALNCDLREPLRALQVPLAFIWGEQAAQTPIRDAHAFWEARPDADFLPLPTGDLPHDERPDAFVAALTGFLDRADAAIEASPLAA